MFSHPLPNSFLTYQLEMTCASDRLNSESTSRLLDAAVENNPMVKVGTNAGHKYKCGIVSRWALNAAWNSLGFLPSLSSDFSQILFQAFCTLFKYPILPRSLSHKLNWWSSSLPLRENRSHQTKSSIFCHSLPPYLQPYLSFSPVVFFLWWRSCSFC